MEEKIGEQMSEAKTAKPDDKSEYNQVEMRCVTMQLIPSPKAEDEVCRYQFVPVGALEQKDGNCWPDTLYAYSKDKERYHVGKSYTFKATI